MLNVLITATVIVAAGCIVAAASTGIVQQVPGKGVIVIEEVGHRMVCVAGAGGDGPGRGSQRPAQGHSVGAPRREAALGLQDTDVPLQIRPDLGPPLVGHRVFGKDSGDLG